MCSGDSRGESLVVGYKANLWLRSAIRYVTALSVSLQVNVSKQEALYIILPQQLHFARDDTMALAFSVQGSGEAG